MYRDVPTYTLHIVVRTIPLAKLRAGAERQSAADDVTLWRWPDPVIVRPPPCVRLTRLLKPVSWGASTFTISRDLFSCFSVFLASGPAGEPVLSLFLFSIGVNPVLRCFRFSARCQNLYFHFFGFLFPRLSGFYALWLAKPIIAVFRFP